MPSKDKTLQDANALTVIVLKLFDQRFIEGATEVEPRGCANEQQNAGPKDGRKSTP